MSEIDVDDWMKHTDYRGYQQGDEVSPALSTSPILRSVLMTNLDRLFNGSGKRSRDGQQRRSLDFCNSLPERVVSPSTDSKISKDPMDLVDSPSRSLERLRNCQRVILVSTVSICHRTPTMRREFRFLSPVRYSIVLLIRDYPCTASSRNSLSP